MRRVLPEKLQAGRVVRGPRASKPEYGPYGMFYLMGPCGEHLVMIGAGAEFPEEEGWEHVSVSTKRRPPNWQEMCFAKDLFWDESETVIQLHPPKALWINNHPRCLHLWKITQVQFPLPPAFLVGIQHLGELTQAQADELWRRNDQG